MHPHEPFGELLALVQHFLEETMGWFSRKNVCHSVEREIKHAQLISSQILIVPKSLLNNGEILPDICCGVVVACFLLSLDRHRPVTWAIAAADCQAIRSCTATPFTHRESHVPAIFQVVGDTGALEPIGHLLLEGDVVLRQLGTV